MTIFVVKQMCAPMDRQRGAFVKEKDAETECERLSDANPSADGFYVEPMEVKE